MDASTATPSPLWELALDDGDGVWWGTPADPAVAEYYDRQGERIEAALELAHGMQGAPGIYPFTDCLLRRLESQYRDRREEIVRNYRRRQRRTVLEEFEWVSTGTDTEARDDGSSQASAAGLGSLICEDCQHFSLPLTTVGQKRVCADCFVELGYENQTQLGQF